MKIARSALYVVAAVAAGIATGCSGEASRAGRPVIQYAVGSATVICLNDDETSSTIGVTMESGLPAVETNCTWHCARATPDAAPTRVDLAWVSSAGAPWVLTTTSLPACD